MNTQDSRMSLSPALMWLSVLLAFYLFSVGPVYRLWPDVAPSIYRPLEIPARTQLFTNLIRAYLCFWGVKSSPY